MARDQIAINFTANVSEVSRGTATMQRDLTKTTDSIEDVGQAGEKTSKKFMSAADQIAKSAKKSGEDVERSYKDGFDAAGRSAGDLKTSVSDAVSQITEGFDGSAESLASGFAGALESVSSLIPGVGALVGGALGAIAVGMSSSWQENSELAAQAVSDMYDDMIESGTNYLSEDFINRRIGDIIKSTEDWNRVRSDAKTLGVDESTVLRANAGDLDALNSVISAANDKRADYQKTVEDEIAINGRGSQETLIARDAAGALADKYLALTQNQDSAAGKANAARDAMSGAAAAADTASAAVGTLAEELSKLPPGMNIPITADTTAIDIALERLRRQTISTKVEVDYVINERRGRQVLE